MKKHSYILIGVILIILSGLYFSIYSIDGDKLHYSEENKYNTNSFDYDTDNDGLADKFEIENGYDPRHKTVLLSITYKNNLLNSSSKNFIEIRDIKKYIQIIKEKFDKAPINNPDGKKGINLHINYNKTNEDKKVNEMYTDKVYMSEYEDKKVNEMYTDKVYMSEYENYIKQKTFDKQGEGYYNILIVEEACNNNSCRVIGVANYINNGAITERGTNIQTASTIMHELGHLLGISNLDYKGVDSTEKSWSEYTSVMNYNRQYNLEYATEPYNDWKEIKQTIKYKPINIQNHNKIIYYHKKISYTLFEIIDHPIRTPNIIFYLWIVNNINIVLNILQIILLVIFCILICKYDT